MTLSKIFSHPLTHLFSFCIILVGSAQFGGPYVFFLWHAVRELHAYAIPGWMAITLTICALFFSGRREAVLQFIAAALMVVSLAAFVFSAERFMNIYVWRQFVPILTLILFVGVEILVVRKCIKAGRS